MRSALLTVVAVTAAALGAGNPIAAGPEIPAHLHLAQNGAQPAGGDQTRAASLEGKDLVGPAGKKLGRIEKIVGDRLIVSVGGFLGIGTKTVLLSQDQIDVARTGRGVEVVTGLTEAAFKAMPEYKADDEAPRADGKAGGAR